MMSARYGYLQPPATYARGRNCIDYGFASPHVVQAISLCGYEQFNSRYSTDHRAYFFEFDTAKLFGRQTPALASTAQRILHSTNVKQVTNYLKIKYEYLNFERAERLTFPGDRHRYAERLDNDMVQASLVAEKKSKRYGAPAWSVALDQARKRVTILKKCLSMAKTQLNLNAIVETSNAALNQPMELPRTKQDCCNRLREAKREVKEIVAASYQQRDRERKQRILQLEMSGMARDATHARQLRRIQKAEEIKALMSTIRNARTSNQRRGVTSIEIPVHPDSDPKTWTEWQIIEVPTDVITHLQNRNRLHFSQAHGTPFTVPPLSERLGFCGDASGTRDILEGRMDATGHGPHVQLLLKHLNQIDEIAQHPTYPTISEADFVGKLKVWKESTTTSPSGLHLGHYKALVAQHQFSNDDPDTELADSVGMPEFSKREEWDRMQQEMRTFHLHLINYALERGYSYLRWQ